MHPDRSGSLYPGEDSMRRTVLVLVGLLLAGHPVSVWAQTSQQPRAEPTAQKAARIAGTAIYTPLKAGLCVLGGGASLFAFLSGGASAMRAVQRESCTGTWVLTPAMMKGQEPIDFLGEIPIP
jgi:hypothetical protein